MPQYSDLSEQQLHAIAAYIHYGRQRSRYAELTQSVLQQGDAAAGRADFEARCASCHAAGGDLAGIGRKYDPAMLRARMLEPPGLTRGASFALDRIRDTRTASARVRHERLLENFSAPVVANLLAFLQAN